MAGTRTVMIHRGAPRGFLPALALTAFLLSPWAAAEARADAAADAAAAVLTARLLELEAPSVTGAGASVRGEANAANLISDATVRAFADANAQAWTALRGELAAMAWDSGVVETAMGEAGTTLGRTLSGLAETLGEAAARFTETLAAGADARDHDPLDTDLPCAALARDAAAMTAPLAVARQREGIALALAALADDGNAGFADALHRRERSLLTGGAMAGKESFEAGWLLPAAGLVEGDDLVRQLLMLDTLANPLPARAVPEATAATATGRAAAMALRQKSALTALAAGALAAVAASTAPLPVYTDAVEGLGDDMGQESAQAPAAGSFGEEDGYSRLQYLEALRRHALGATASSRLAAAGAAQALRMAADMERHVYDLAAAEHGLALWRTALLAALAGDGGGGARAAARLMESAR